MVKVSIIGAENPVAGELIRILVHHPETELISLFSPNYSGRSVSALHHGLIGENPLYFSDKIDFENTDLYIITTPSGLVTKLKDIVLNDDSTKLISLRKDFIKEVDSSEIGLSEINRKALVRGAKFAYIPSSLIAGSLIVLVPLAHFLLLRDEINISLYLPKDIIKDTNFPEETESIENILKRYQHSFNGKVSLNISQSDGERQALAIIRLNSQLSIEEIKKIYSDIYDDHNFTFLSENKVDTSEIEGTQKTLLYIYKPSENTLEIQVVYDPRMRGGAGDITHVMNLFFGLHEKTGLDFKPSRFYKNIEK